MDFDYKKAWMEVAKPAVNYITAGSPIHDLLTMTVQESSTIKQGADLDCVGASDILVGGLFREAEKNPSLVASAARAVYFFGHWGSSADLQGSGSYWKFANLADQALCKVIGIKRDRRGSNKHGRIVEIHEGVIRVCLSTASTWTWKEVCLATPANYNAIDAAAWTPIGDVGYTRSDRDKWVDSQMEIIKALRTAFAPRTGPVAGFFNLAKYGGNAD